VFPIWRFCEWRRRENRWQIVFTLSFFYSKICTWTATLQVYAQPWACSNSFKFRGKWVC